MRIGLKANLRFRDGSAISVEVSGTEWPHVIRWTRKKRVDFRVLSRPYDDAPVRTVDDVIECHIDRATFDPDRNWQNYVEAVNG